MPITEVAARRYATALMDVATERGSLKECLGNIERFRDTVFNNVELGATFQDPTFPVSAASRLVATLAGRLGLDQTSTAFLQILATRRRLDGLADIVGEFYREMDRRAGRASGEVVSAAPLNDAQLARIKAAIDKRTGLDVNLTRRIDQSLLGGLQVVVGDRVIDFSTRTYLDSLKTRLLHNR